MSDAPASDAAAPAASQDPAWRGILEADEQILWQGKPEPGFRLEFGALSEMIPSLLIAGFGLFWTMMVLRDGSFLALFGLLFVFIGLRNLLMPVLTPALLRHRTWYTLTDRRAIIATNVPTKGRRLASYPLHDDTVIELVQGDPPSILFGPAAGRRAQRPGFRFIRDADVVMPLIRRVQRHDAAASAEATA